MTKTPAPSLLSSLSLKTQVLWFCLDNKYTANNSFCHISHLTWFTDQGNLTRRVFKVLLLASEWTSIWVPHPPASWQWSVLATDDFWLTSHCFRAAVSSELGSDGVRPDSAWQGIVAHGCSRGLHQNCLWSSCTSLCKSDVPYQKWFPPLFLPLCFSQHVYFMN